MIKRYVTRTFEISDTYNRIILDVKSANVKIEPSNENSTKLTFYENKKLPHEFYVQDGALIIKPSKAKWYNFFKIGVKHSKIRICVHDFTPEAISARVNVGHIDMQSITANGTVEIQANTGDINLENVSCKGVDLKGNTGDVSLNGVAAEQSISVNHDTGKVLLNGCHAPKIFVKTKTGNVSGRLPKSTSFAVRTSTGKIEIPTSPVGEFVCGICEIETRTGNICVQSLG